MNVFEPRIVTGSPAPLASPPTVPSPLPTRREKLTTLPDWLTNVKSERGFSTPAAAFSSVHDVVNVPTPRTVVSAVGAIVWLSATSKRLANDDVPATSARNLPGTWPLSEPERLVATSLPAALSSVAPLNTALLPSTAPALRAKLTAATLVPPSATNSAISATTMAGDGLRNLMEPPLRDGSG